MSDLYHPIVSSDGTTSCFHCDGKSHCFCRQCDTCRVRYKTIRRDDQSTTCEDCLIGGLTWTTLAVGHYAIRMEGFQLLLRRIGEKDTWSMEAQLNGKELQSKTKYRVPIWEAMKDAVRFCRDYLMSVKAPTRVLDAFNRRLMAGDVKAAQETANKFSAIMSEYTGSLRRQRKELEAGADAQRLRAEKAEAEIVRLRAEVENLHSNIATLNDFSLSQQKRDAEEHGRTQKSLEALLEICRDLTVAVDTLQTVTRDPEVSYIGADAPVIEDVINVALRLRTH